MCIYLIEIYATANAQAVLCANLPISMCSHAGHGLRSWARLIAGQWGSGCWFRGARGVSAGSVPPRLLPTPQEQVWPPCPFAAIPARRRGWAAPIVGPPPTSAALVTRGISQLEFPNVNEVWSEVELPAAEHPQPIPPQHLFPSSAFQNSTLSKRTKTYHCVSGTKDLFHMSAVPVWAEYNGPIQLSGQ